MMYHKVIMAYLFSGESLSCFGLSESNVIKKQAKNDPAEYNGENATMQCNCINQTSLLRFLLPLKTYQGCRWMVSHGNKYLEVCCCGISEYHI